MLREYVVSEAMHALGIPTTRSLAVLATGRTVSRETLLPGAVLARVAGGHLRVGSVQYARATGVAPAGTRLPTNIRRPAELRNQPGSRPSSAASGSLSTSSRGSATSAAGQEMAISASSPAKRLSSVTVGGRATPTLREYVARPWRRRHSRGVGGGLGPRGSRGDIWTATGAETWVMVDKITTVRRARIARYVGRLSAAEMVAVERLLMVFLGLAA